MKRPWNLIVGRTHASSLACAQADRFASGDLSSRLHVSCFDLEQLGLAAGDAVQVTSDVGSAALRVVEAVADELPRGSVFLATGPAAARLVSADTRGVGLPISKLVPVTIERATVIERPLPRRAAETTALAGPLPVALGVAQLASPSGRVVPVPNGGASQFHHEQASTIPDAVCTRCGCTCDDLTLVRSAGKVVAAHQACELGRAWFTTPRDETAPVCLVAGKLQPLQIGLQHAARLLARAQHPLVFGLSETTCEAQVAAVALADRLRATIDTATSIGHGPSVVALQSVGEVTGTLGEMRHRGDLVLYWGANPVENDPRHQQRYSLDPAGEYVPRGRADRFCVVVDVRQTATARTADQFIRIRPGADFEALWTLRALVQGRPVDATMVDQQTGVPLAVWSALAERMRACRFGVLLYGMGLNMTSGQHQNVEAVLLLVRDLHAHTRFVCRSMRAPGNVTGADNVLTWRTGYPFAVNLARGYPRYNPGEYSVVDVLVRREVDAALIVAANPLETLPAAAADVLQSLPLVVLDSVDTATMAAAQVAFRVATPGLSTPGTVYRMDEVPLALRPALASVYPTAEDVLRSLEQQIASSQRGQPTDFAATPPGA